MVIAIDRPLHGSFPALVEPRLNYETHRWTLEHEGANSFTRSHFQICQFIQIWIKFVVCSYKKILNCRYCLIDVAIRFLTNSYNWIWTDLLMMRAGYQFQLCCFHVEAEVLKLKNILQSYLRLLLLLSDLQLQEPKKIFWRI